ncbi:hypothetical protein MKZ38_005991 [Zalerion maritima]|uniref:Nephrocystin 3-like N-terminal domain-containing protein n=1 Tax=Zalerion maritima TaxID=339359 RepID=A0AAD5WQ11_9PEZI|nr:hypothetical protein MKZ38_005991 [Zalerion maritima]
METASSDKTAAEEILKALYFPSMFQHGSNGLGEEAEDYKWILDDNAHDEKGEQQRAEMQAMFVAWLRLGGGIFHVSGKPGSGKSTLMRSLVQHERTHKELVTWAQRKNMTFGLASLSFQGSGSEVAASLEGLYRSILFATLRLHAHLVPIVFPAQWDHFTTTEPSVQAPQDLFSAAEVRKAFDVLVGEASFPSRRFCLFIDGLDQYRGDEQERASLVDGLQRWAEHEDVKLCVSSGPNLELDHLICPPAQRFRMSDVNRSDITEVCAGMIEQELVISRPKDADERLAREVARLSDGVFVWARLATRFLLTGVRPDDTMNRHEQKLVELPKDVDELFHNILESFDADTKERATKLLLMRLHDPFRRLPLSCSVYDWTDNLSDPQFPTSEWATKHPRLGQGVELDGESLTKGLLKSTKVTLGDVGEINELEFFHPTFKHLAMVSPRLQELAKQYSSIIKPESCYRLLLADLTRGDFNYRRAYWNSYITSEVTVGCFFEHALPVSLVDAFSLVLDDSKDTSPKKGKPEGNETFRGAESMIRLQSVSYHRKMSFLHMAAYVGQNEYVLREVSDRPELLRGNSEGTMHLLYSAARGGNMYLIAELLKMGSSPMDPIAIRLDTPGNPISEVVGQLFSVPIWLVVTAQMMGSYIAFGETADIYFDVLEMFLEKEDIEVRTGAMLFVSMDGPMEDGIHYVTLEGFVRDVRPENQERLVELIEKGKKRVEQKAEQGGEQAGQGEEPGKGRELVLRAIETLRKFLNELIPCSLSHTEGHEVEGKGKGKEVEKYTLCHTGWDDTGMDVIGLVYEGKKSNYIGVRLF